MIKFTPKNLTLKLIISTFSIASIIALFLFSPILGFDAAIFGMNDQTIRTIAHLNVFGFIAFLLLKSLLNNQFLLTFILISVVATIEEISQLAIQYRGATTEDWLFNMIGITCWVLIAKHSETIISGFQYFRFKPGAQSSKTTTAVCSPATVAVKAD